MKAKKSLGQHFLKSKGVVKSMVAGAKISAEDTVIEIGPGKGILTERLLEAGARVIALEKDGDMLSILEEKFKEQISSGVLRLINGDVLEFNPSEIDVPYKIVANIPYYITGAILRKFLEAEHQPSSMTVLVQKEVADRVVAQDGKESILSISVKVYGMPKKGMKVKAELFSPAPNVDSAILYIESISKQFFKGVLEQGFFLMLKAGFAHKRKFVISNLKKGFEVKKATWNEIFAENNINQKARPEDISLEEWKKLYSNASA